MKRIFVSAAAVALTLATTVAQAGSGWVNGNTLNGVNWNAMNWNAMNANGMMYQGMMIQGTAGEDKIGSDILVRVELPRPECDLSHAC